MLAWQEDAAFRSFYSHTLQQSPFDAFFWEHPPINKQHLNDPYEFVLVKSESFQRLSPQPSAFAAHFDGKQAVVSFPNLGKDAQLIVPAPLSALENYTHLAHFIRSAPAGQIDAFWQMVGLHLEQAIGKSYKWLSTAGLGVHWVHVRIDSRPKYYRYRTYASV